MSVDHSTCLQGPTLDDMWSDRCLLVFRCPQDPVPSANVSYWKPGLLHEREEELMLGCRHRSWLLWALPLRGEPGFGWCGP